MIDRDLLMIKFPDGGFRLEKQDDPDNKFWMIDEDKVKIGDTFVVMANGYFSYNGNIVDDINNERNSNSK